VRKNRLQTSLNLALGSAVASIGLTIPTVAIVCFFSDMKINLGIDAKSTVLLLMSLFVISISFNTNKTNIQQGIVLLVLFATYLFTTVVPYTVDYINLTYQTYFRKKFIMMYVCLLFSWSCHTFAHMETKIIAHRGAWQEFDLPQN